MTLQISEDTVHARSFFVAPGIDALQRAEDIRVHQFGHDSRLATLPEIISARTASPLDTPVWRLPYITTTTAVYIGKAQDTPYIVVAHGVGPMATLIGAYEFIHAYPDVVLERQRIFNRIVRGEYGEVTLFDAREIEDFLMQLPGYLSFDEALGNRFILSLFGDNDCAERYLRILAESDTHQTLVVGERHVMPSHMGFEQFNILEESEYGPSSFFVRIDGIGRHACKKQCTSYCSQVALHHAQHAWRFVGIQGTQSITSIRLGAGDLSL